MPTEEKPIKPWVLALGQAVSGPLSEAMRRKFVFKQTGTFTQGPTGLTGIVFHESELRNVKSPVATDRADDRFGFEVWREYQTRENRWSVYGGFSTWNKALARVCFMRNVRDNAASIETRVLAWLNRYGLDAWIDFDQEGNRRFDWRTARGSVDLKGELRRFGDLDRKSSGKHKDRPGGWTGSQFAVRRLFTTMCSLSEEELAESAEFLGAELLESYKELEFLYLLLWPHEKPSHSEDCVPDVEPFDPEAVDQVRERIEALVATRLGQPEFRQTLLRAYRGRCAVTGCDVEDALQAAHLFPYTGMNSNRCSNGVLLRADIHNLFDKHLMAIEPGTNEVRVAPGLRGTAYETYDGRVVILPENPNEAPHPRALEHRFNLFAGASGGVSDNKPMASKGSPRIRLFDHGSEDED